jgi:hypothetical protein
MAYVAHCVSNRGQLIGYSTNLELMHITVFGSVKPRIDVCFLHYRIMWYGTMPSDIVYKVPFGA